MTNDFRIYITWLERVRTGDRDEVVSYGKVLVAHDRESANLLFRRCKSENAWLGPAAYSIQIDTFGPGGSSTLDRASPSVTAAGIAAVKAALSGCKGPVFKGLADPISREDRAA